MHLFKILLHYLEFILIVFVSISIELFKTHFCKLFLCYHSKSLKLLLEGRTCLSVSWMNHTPQIFKIKIRDNILMCT